MSRRGKRGAGETGCGHRMRKLPILVFFAASLIVCGPDTQRRDERRRSLEIVEALTFYLFYHPCLPFAEIVQGQSQTVVPSFDFNSCTISSTVVTATIAPLGGQDVFVEDFSCSGRLTGTINAGGPGASESIKFYRVCNSSYDFVTGFYRVRNVSGNANVSISVN